MAGRRSSSSTKNDSPYIAAYDGLTFRLNELEDLNRKLPKALHAESEKEHAQWAKRVANADSQIQSDVARIFSRIVNSQGQSTVRSNEASRLVREYLLSVLDYASISKFVREMSLVFLISQFEIFLEQMISITLQKNPGPIMEKNITLKQLAEWKSFKKAKEQIIEKEIHNVRLTSPENVDSYFSRMFKVQLSTFPKWSEFRERFYRRHAIVHNSGEPDHAYLEKTGLKRKGPLEVTRNYLTTSIRLSCETAQRIAKQFEKRFGPEWPEDYP